MVEKFTKKKSGLVSAYVHKKKVFVSKFLALYFLR